jgi:YVTN family beta-propeller protein
LALALGCKGGSSADDTPPAAAVPCEAPPPPAEATRKLHDGGPTVLLPGGRSISPAGAETVLGGFPVEVRAHPTLPVAYIANTGHDKRSLQVVDRARGTLLQDLDRQDAFFGLALAPDGQRLFASGGASGLVEVYDVQADGTLKAAAQIPVPGYPAGLAFSPDGKRVWVGQLLGKVVSEIDTATLAVLGDGALPYGAYGLAWVPGVERLFVTGFRGGKVAVINPADRSLVTEIDVGKNPEGIVVAPDGSRVYVTSSDADRVIAIDPATGAIVGQVPVGEATEAGEDGSPLPASSPGGLALADGKLYVARAADNAVGVLDAATLAPLGAIPTGWYPTSVAVSDGVLLVTNGKGVGATASNTPDKPSAISLMKGSISAIPLANLDLAAATQAMEKNLHRPRDVYPFSCDTSFPVPTRPGMVSPIEHVILLVRENKTYDAVLGDLAGTEADPTLTMFGESITPNLHALARRYTSHDNYYADSEASVQGHEWLTASFVPDYIERAWIEDYRGSTAFSTDSGVEYGQPGFGSLFTHLIKHKVLFRNFGEVVGSLGEYQGDAVLKHTDLHFPGCSSTTASRTRSRPITWSTRC